MLAEFALHCLAERPPLVSGSETPAIASETSEGCRGRAKVSNELSNYCGGNGRPRLDDPGSFGAPGICIGAYRACFTPKRSLVRTQYRPPQAKRL